MQLLEPVNKYVLLVLAMILHEQRFYASKDEKLQNTILYSDYFEMKLITIYITKLEKPQSGNVYC